MRAEPIRQYEMVTIQDITNPMGAKDPVLIEDELALECFLATEF